LAMEYLKISADLFSLHVPYRGTGPMLTDLLAGRLEAASVGAPAVLQHIKSGKLRCLATGSAARIPQLPDVPTVAEQGFAGFEMTQWYGLLAPASMPEAHVQKLATEASKAVRSAGAMERLSADAALAVGGSSADFAKFIAAEQTRWKAVVVRAKIKPD
jgi:tripartite-type tricarboxylate transporter receptor subunit TctC